MSFWRQKNMVKQLSDRATERKKRLVELRGKMRRWKQQTFGQPESLAWAFAAGVVVSAVSGGSETQRRGRSVVVKALNASLLTWRLFGRPGLDEAQSALVGDAAPVDA